MRIVVLGGGTVGMSIAELLCRHRHSVTVVDSSADHARRINESLDVKAVVGSASQSSVLFQAGVLDADLCLAVTGVDEVNLVAASMAKAMGAHRTVARVYAPVFRDLSTFDYQRHFKVDRLVSLEHLSAMELARGIRHPGSVAVENLAGGQLQVQEIEVTSRSSSIGVTLRELGLPKGIRIGSIVRESTMWIAGADDKLEPGDRITLIGSIGDIDEVRDIFRGAKQPKQKVVIAGGGETGYHLARALQGPRFATTLMEADLDRCQYLAANLKDTTVVHSDATRRVSLEEERIGSAHTFVACVGDDENNILACVEARELGTPHTMAIVSRPDYANVVGKLGIDIAVSPREVVAKQVLSYLSSGPVISLTPLSDGTISVLEIEVLPDTPASEHVLANLRLPSQSLIAGVVHDEFARVPGADDRLQPGDTVIAMVNSDKVDEFVRAFNSENA